MNENECWNCKEAVQDSWNYCPACTCPITSELVLQELIECIEKKENILENAPKLVSQALNDRYSETELRRIVEEVGNEEKT